MPLSPTTADRPELNPFFKDHLQGAVERGLAERGFELARSGTPDLLIHYNQDWLEKKIDEAVTRILETLPRRL